MSTLRIIERAEERSAPPEMSDAAFALAPIQEGMLFHSLLAPESEVYFEQIVYRLKGTLEIRLFQQAWEAVVRHHDVLRTSFSSDGIESPSQQVHEHVSLPFHVHDWRNDDTDNAGRLQSLLESDRALGFDVSRPPLMRVNLIRCSDDECQMIWSSHHILLDGWSQALLLQKVFQTYRTLREHRPVQHDPVRPYRDFVKWIREYDLTEAEIFWRKSLQGFDEPTRLGVERRSLDDGGSNFSYAEAELELGCENTAALQKFARQHRLTSYTLVQAAWALLLSRYSQRDDIVFGTTVSIRPPDLVGIEATPGLFINTLPVRARLQHNQPLIDWLQDLQLDAVEAREHQYIPLVKIQSSIDVPRGLPLFNSILVFENFPADALPDQLGDELKVERSRSFLSRTNYPLTVLVEPGQSLMLRVVYDRLTFDDDAIDRVLGNLHTILNSMISNADQSVGSVRLLTVEEERELISERNQTAVAYEDQVCIHQLFERQAELTPNAIAVSFAEQELSFAELNARANRLAHYLRTRGVGPDTLVGICIERSIEMLVGLLAIQKAGGAYVPLDPSFPKERLAFMADDANLSILLTQEKLIAELPEHPAVVVCIDSDWEMIERESDQAPINKVSADNLAYVIYTSGSTGKPKGVAVEHRALTNFLISMSRAPGMSAADVLVSVTTLSFDIAALELYLPLITGGRLVIVSRETAMDGHLLKEALSETSATMMQATPATWKTLIEAGWSGNKAFKILCGGEAWSVELAREFLSRGGSVWNMYGPTETTVWSTVCRIENEEDPVAIGQPIANTQVYLLDEHLRPVPFGVAGELYIGGDGLARGYLNRPELTTEKFIRNPFSDKQGSRIYRTGDLARYLSDGNLECLGRADDQVKIRGFRIEPGEIESILLSHPTVSQTVVVARRDATGEFRLIAYIVAAANSEINQKDLRSLLQSSLPEYMMPSALIELPALPLTPNGKINRHALPDPDYDANMYDNYVAPRSAAEGLLAGIWADILRLQRVGINDNFFELGGHSLLAVRLFAQIEKIFGKRLPLATLFQAPTIKQLALVLKEEGWVAPWSSLVVIQPEQEGGSKRPLFCVHALGGNVLEFYDLARYLGPDQPFYAFQSFGLDGSQEPLASIEEMAAHYIKEMRQVQSHGPYLMAGRSFGGTVAFEMACQLREQGEEVGLVALLDTYPVGYFKLQSTVLSRGQRVRRFIRRMKCHADNLQKLEVVDKFKYFLEKAQFAPAKIKHGLWQGSAHFFERLNRPLPKFLRSIEHLNWKAALEYVPRIYDGRIALFWASVDLTTAYDLLDGWRVLAPGGIDVHEIPGSHIDIIKEPHVRFLAAELSSCLKDEAPSRASLTA